MRKMKRVVFKLFLTVVLSTFAYNLYSAPATKAAVFDRVSLKIDTVGSPDVDYTSSLPVSASGRKHTNSWNLISVDFYPVAKEPGKSAKLAGSVPVNITDSRYWLDDVVITVRAVCESASEASPDRHVLFTGSCKLLTVPLDNRKHTVWFFLPPHLLDRYYVPKSNYSTSVNSRDGNYRGPIRGKVSMSNFKINKSKLLLEVVISCDGGTRELAREYLNVRGGKKDAQLKEFNKLVGKVPNKYNFEGAVLSKGQSPWAYFKVDQFDLEKVTAR